METVPAVRKAHVLRLPRPLHHPEDSDGTVGPRSEAIGGARGETVDLTSGTGIPLRPGTVPHRGDARQCPLEHAAAFFRFS